MPGPRDRKRRKSRAVGGWAAGAGKPGLWVGALWPEGLSLAEVLFSSRVTAGFGRDRQA